MDARIAGIVFAAGRSSRMGFNKLIADLCGMPVLAHVLVKVCSIDSLDPKILVVGFEHDRVLSAAKNYGLEKFKVAINREYERGLSTSMRKALELAMNVDAFMFIHGDMPLIKAETIERLASLYMEREPLILIPRYMGTRGSPVIVSSALREELSRIEGDIGARALFGKYRERITYVDVDDEYILFDIDTPEDLKRARSLCSQS